MANGNNEQQQNNASTNSNNSSNNSEQIGVADGAAVENLRLVGAGDAPTLSSSNTDVTSGNVAGGGFTRGTLNDLVADLCLSSSNSSRYGDYTNIRATSDRCGSTVGTLPSTTQQSQPAPSATGSSSVAPSSSFSFKHFLNSSGTVTAPSTTVTSLDAVTSTTAANTTITSSTSAASSSTSIALQTSTGARPKVPQSASASLTDTLGSSSASCSTSKMKRSPRFSSFDSQASLAEYASVGAVGRGSTDEDACGLSIDNDTTTAGDDEVAEDVRRGRVFGEFQFRDFFPSTNTLFATKSGGSTSTTATGATSNSRYVPRSYSSYDMPPPATANASPGRRSKFNTGNREARPNRLQFSTNQNSGKMKLDLPLDTANSAAVAAGASGNNSNSGSMEYASAPSAAAALPDFVQDHWLDSWNAHDMHLNSPPNSPICEFGVGADNFSVAGSAMCGLAGLPDAANISGGVTVAGAASDGTAVKMLPDFLSDGPIIHSSQRLADVAAGLPSNSIGSPQDTSTSLHLSTLRLENERLQRELSEARMELSVQTRRSNELDRQVQQEVSRRRETPATTQRLRQQVAQLKAEVAALHRENESLRDAVGGAVGGVTANCDRTAASADLGATAGTTGNLSASAAHNSGVPTASSSSNISRPSRTQLSRDLLRAAANAESNLRQLLAGVDNLRQMAAGLENTVLSVEFDVSPDPYSDFIEDEEDFDEYNSNAAAGGAGAA